MTDGLITPWAAEYDLDDQYVPKEVEAMARRVLTHYNWKVSSMRLVTAKPDKAGAIWRVDTNRGPFSLKLLHRPPQRSLFSIGAIEYLVKQGARVPPLIRTKTNEAYVQMGGKLWIANKWIEPLTQASKVDLEGAELLSYGLAEFQRHSRGYVPPPGAQKASRLHRWPKTYERMLTKIQWFRILANLYSEMPASRLLLDVIGKYEEQAKKAIARLHESPYASLVARGEPHWGIVHQDYGWSNGQLGPGGVWVIDMDGVSYDLPIRDLRKLIAGTMDDMGVWDVSWVQGMINAYRKGYPVDNDLYEVLLIDLSLPNEFYKLVKEIVYDPGAFLNNELESQLQRLEQVEASKQRALRELQAPRKGGKKR